MSAYGSFDDIVHAQRGMLVAELPKVPKYSAQLFARYRA